MTDAQFEREIARCQKPLAKFLTKRFGAEMAEDAAVEASLNAWRRRDQFGGKASFGAWFTRIGLNAARDLANGAVRHKDLSYDWMPKADGDSFIEMVPSEFSDPVDAIVRRDMLEEIFAAVESIPAHLRDIFTLAVIEGLSYEEVSEALRLPMGTVKSRLNRARRIIREKVSLPA